VSEALTSRDVLRFATLEGAKCLHLDGQIGKWRGALLVEHKDHEKRPGAYTRGKFLLRCKPPQKD
jgi:hypothetical protein